VRLQPGVAVLTPIDPPGRQSSARLGDTLVLRGSYLDGDMISVQFVHPRLSNPIILSLAEPAASRLELQIPDKPDTWAAGLYGVTVQGFRDGRLAWSTNTLPLALAPRIAGAQAEKEEKDKVRVTTITITCSPQVWPGQRVALLLGERELPGAAVKSATGKLIFKADDIAPGSYFVRLRVDGVDSLLVDTSATPPAFDPTQRVVIPN
jgi:hypothetical protein